MHYRPQFLFVIMLCIGCTGNSIPEAPDAPLEDKTPAKTTTAAAPTETEHQPSQPTPSNDTPEIEQSDMQSPNESQQQKPEFDNDDPPEAQSDTSTRTWVDRNGKTVEADFVVLIDGKVRMRRTTDGRIFDVPLERLSQGDQEFVRQQPRDPLSANPAPSDSDPTKPLPPLNVGPWEITVTAFKIAKTYEYTFYRDRRRIAAKDDGDLALITFQCTVKRPYTEAEESQLKESSAAAFLKPIRQFNGDAPNLISTAFMLSYVHTVDGKPTFVMSYSPAMDCHDAMRPVEILSSGTIVACADLDTPESTVTLAFHFYRGDQNPVLVFTPFLDIDDHHAIRISTNGEQIVGLEYGSIEQMKKYLPDDLKSRQ